MELEEFRLLLQQVRAGDADAAARLVREYEPTIRRYIRVNLTDPRLRQVLDTMDVCQSVLANFFFRVAAGQFDLQQPDQLLKLLATMARNRLLNHVREQKAARRDNRRQSARPADALDMLPTSAASASQIVAGKELLEVVQRHLDSQERMLLERRMQGQEWAEIAAEVGAGAEALRKKLSRSLDRVAELLGLDRVEDA